LGNKPLYLTAVLAAVVGLALFGVVGVGREGTGNFDMAFLYAAGRTWLRGMNAYVLAERQASVANFPFDVYAFAYPPTVFPLAIILGYGSFAEAKLVMLGLNLLSIWSLCTYCVRMAAPFDSAPAPRQGAYRYLIPAIIIGNPFTAHVVWMGQTSLIVAASIAWGYHFATHKRWLLGGLLLSIGTIKPQFSVIALLWLAIHSKFRAVGAAGVISLLFSVGPLLICGPFATARSWMEDVQVYKANPSNAVDFEHSFGLQSFLFHLNIHIPALALIALAVVLVICFTRSKLLEGDILPILLGTALLFGVAHDYDLVVVAPIVPSLWRHVRATATPQSAMALLAMGCMFLPQRALKPFHSAALLQFRVIILSAVLAWLFVLSTREARKENNLESLGEAPKPSP